MQKIKNSIVFVVAVSAVAVIFQNCDGFQVAKSNLSHRSVLKREVLSSSEVIEVNDYPPVQSEVNPNTGVRVISSFMLPVKTVCSYVGTNLIGGNLMTENEIKVSILRKDGSVACTITDSAERKIRQRIIDEKRVVLNDVSSLCPGLVEGQYDLVVGSSQVVNLLTPVYNPETFTIRPFPVEVRGNSDGILELHPKDGVIAYVAYAGGINTPPPQSPLHHGQQYNISYDVDCDEHASPLIIHIDRPSQPAAPLALTSPDLGIFFDILGANARPTPHEKRRISWISTTNAMGNYFLVLPDANGKVLGVDHLFGDNTLGPDGQFAANGYEALRKWDGRLSSGQYGLTRDGYITAYDEVFSFLRLWSDKNGDGVSDASELFYLSQLGISAIDLFYDGTYREVDAYGNQIMFKSVAHGNDGTFHAVFDIWFSLN